MFRSAQVAIGTDGGPGSPSINGATRGEFPGRRAGADTVPRPVWHQPTGSGVSTVSSTAGGSAKLCSLRCRPIRTNTPTAQTAINAETNPMTREKLSRVTCVPAAPAVEPRVKLDTIGPIIPMPSPMPNWPTAGFTAPTEPTISFGEADITTADSEFCAHMMPKPTRNAATAKYQDPVVGSININEPIPTAITSNPLVKMARALTCHRFCASPAANVPSN